MPKVMVRVTGNRLPQLVQGLNDRGKTAARRYAQQVFQAAQREVPVDTGALKASGHVETTDNGAVVVYDTPYAVYVHFGTSRMPPNPWLERAHAMTMDQWNEAVQGIADWVERG